MERRTLRTEVRRPSSSLPKQLTDISSLATYHIFPSSIYKVRFRGHVAGKFSNRLNLINQGYLSSSPHFTEGARPQSRWPRHTPSRPTELHEQPEVGPSGNTRELVRDSKPPLSSLHLIMGCVVACSSPRTRIELHETFDSGAPERTAQALLRGRRGLVVPLPADHFKVPHQAPRLGRVMNLCLVNRTTPSFSRR